MQSPQTALPNRIDVINAYKARGGAVAAVFPIHYPRALLRAFDILPVEVWNPPVRGASPGTAHLQPYVCSIAQNVLAFLQSGGLEVTDYLIAPHACDSLQGLGSILIDFIKPRQPVIPIYIPRGERQSDLDFLADELRAVYQLLVDLSGRAPSDEVLLECMAREARADELLGELHQRGTRLPLSDLARYQVIRCREYLPAEDFIRLAEETLALPPAPARQAIGVILSGIVPEPMSVLQALSDMGAQVVADDLASCGRRLYQAGQSNEPFHRMAESLVSGPPDPTRGSPIRTRSLYLQHLAEQCQARGVIFYPIKFCEPELFDLPILRQELEAAGIASLVLESEVGVPLSQAAITRLEAFLEILQ